MLPSVHPSPGTLFSPTRLKEYVLQGWPGDGVVLDAQGIFLLLN